MTVKELLTLLEFYPVNAEIFVETQDGTLNHVDEFNETSTANKKAALIMTVKKSEDLP
jgi:hypothetical protein